jgi:hypothetical protein
MPVKKPLSIEIKEKLTRRLINTSQTVNTRMIKELPENKLDGVLDEISLYAFEYEGRVWLYVCGREGVSNAFTERCLRGEASCGYAGSEAAACYECEYLLFVNPLEDTDI